MSILAFNERGLMNDDTSSAFYAVFDLKWMFISSMVVFEAGSALCGAAPDMNALIVGRAIAGLGGTGIFIGFVFCLGTTKETC
jgi:MFS family permease